MTWLSQWNRWQFLTTQLTLISVLFLYRIASLDESLVWSLFLTIVLSYLLAYWIGISLYPIIDQARLQGDFKVMRNTMLVHHMHQVAGIALFVGAVVVGLEWLDSARYTTLSSIVIGVVALDKVLSATLRAQASKIVLQAHALRRSVLILGLMIGLFVLAQPWIDWYLFGLLIATPVSSIVRLLLGHGQMYNEFRYRRQFEDSGNKRSLLSLLILLTRRYASTFVQILMPFGIVVVLALLSVVVALPQVMPSVISSLLLFVAVIALARTVNVTLLPDTSQWVQYVQAGNHVVLRDQLSIITEQLLYRSLIIGLVWFGTGFVLGPSVYNNVPMLLGSTAVVAGTSFYLFDSKVLGLLHPSQQWLIVLVAMVIFAINVSLLLIYYPTVALMISWVMSVLWIHSATLLVWTISFDVEIRVHLIQSAKMIGIAVTSLVVNAGIYWLLRQFPLGVEPFVEQLVFLGLFGIITSVIMYSLTFALGVQRSLKSRTELSQQLATQFMEYEEEEAIW